MRCLEAAGSHSKFVDQHSANETNFSPSLCQLKSSNVPHLRAILKTGFCKEMHLPPVIKMPGNC